MTFLDPRYILKYTNGQYVNRDDSTGPLSSGGYPQRVDTIDQATRFSSPQSAAAYAQVFAWKDLEKAVYPLELILGEPVLVPEVWTECNHNCIQTPEAIAPEAKHFLDCPVWGWGNS